MPQDPSCIMEAGPLRFACEHGWGALPPDYVWGITHAVAEDSRGNIHIAHTVRPNSRCRDAILVFDASGAFIRSWGNAFEGSVHGLEIVSENGTNFAYLTDLERGLFKLTLDGEIVWRFEKPALYRKIFGLNWRPSNVALAPGTDLYLSDGYGTGFIIRVDRETGREIDFFGGPGNAKNNLVHPHGLIIDTRQPEPLLLVAENLDNRFHYLSLDGEHRRFEREADNCLIAPRHFAIQDQLLLMPDLGGRLSLFDRENRLVGHLGDAQRPFEELVALHDDAAARFATGTFYLPHDAIFDRVGNIIVVEWISTGRVSKLTRLHPADLQ